MDAVLLNHGELSRDPYFTDNYLISLPLIVHHKFKNFSIIGEKSAFALATSQI
jgi:hypothetical protein